MDFDEFVDKVLTSFKPTKDYFFNKQVLNELYETEYGICDHTTTSNPLSSVQFHPAEEYMQNYLYDNYLSTFIYRDLGKKLNMSFDDFISRPRYEIEAIIRVTSVIDEKKAKTNEDMLKSLESNNKPDD